MTKKLVTSAWLPVHSTAHRVKAPLPCPENTNTMASATMHVQRNRVVAISTSSAPHTATSPWRLAFRSLRERESEKLFPSRSSPLIPLAHASLVQLSLSAAQVTRRAGCAKLGLKVTLGWHIITIIIIIALVVMTITQTTMSVIQLDVTRKRVPWEKPSPTG